MQFKEGSVDEDKHKAFITGNDVQTPNGFGKVVLPFLDPNEASKKPLDDLPPVFIAPVGYKVPSGYKGHPLPYDPTVGDRFDKEKVNLIHSTGKPILDDSSSPNEVEPTTNPFVKHTRKQQPTGTFFQILDFQRAVDNFFFFSYQ